MKYNVKEMVGKDKLVTFVRYIQGNLIYSTDDGFQFPVPIVDLGEAEIKNKEKAILMMRYIRKQIALLEVD